MNLNLDSRFAVPPLVNMLCRLLFSDDEGGDHPTLNTSSVTLRGGGGGGFFFFFFFLLMLISIKLPLKFSVEFSEPIQIQLPVGRRTDGNFYYNNSWLLLAVAVLASSVSRPLIFWYTYFISIIIILISPWLLPLLNFLKRFFQTTFSSTPTANPETELAPQSGIELNIDIDGDEEGLEIICHGHA